jgi:hypothetical protein
MDLDEFLDGGFEAAAAAGAAAGSGSIDDAAGGSSDGEGDGSDDDSAELDAVTRWAGVVCCVIRLCRGGVFG